MQRKQQRNKKKDKDTSHPVTHLVPFPPQLITEATYEWPLVLLQNAISATDYINLCPSSLTSYDYMPKLGYNGITGQNVSYLLGVNGPYRRYRVLSWQSEFTIINDSVYPLDVYVQDSEYVTDNDTLAEIRESLRCKHVTLDCKGGGTTKRVIKTRGNCDETNPSIVDGTYESGSAITPPVQRTYQTLVFNQPAVGIRYFISVRTKVRVNFFDRYTNL